MVRRFLWFVIAIALPLHAWAESGSVRGVVREALSGKPLAGASVSLMQPTKKAQAEIRFQELTKEDGTYTLSGIPAGTYSMTVVYPQLKPAAKPDVVIQSNQELVLDFQIGAY